LSSVSPHTRPGATWTWTSAVAATAESLSSVLLQCRAEPALPAVYVGSTVLVQSGTKVVSQAKSFGSHQWLLNPDRSPWPKKSLALPPRS
jgi:hypothetical protein